MRDRERPPRGRSNDQDLSSRVSALLDVLGGIISPNKSRRFVDCSLKSAEASFSMPHRPHLVRHAAATEQANER
jgi:hypothetical protein